MSQRSLLPKGYTLKSKNRTYTIDGFQFRRVPCVLLRYLYAGPAAYRTAERTVSLR